MSSIREGQRGHVDGVARLSELGRLVEISGLCKLVDGDQAAILGGLLELAERLRALTDAGVDPGHLTDHWRRRSYRAANGDAALAIGQTNYQGGCDVLPLSAVARDLSEVTLRPQMNNKWRFTPVRASHGWEMTPVPMRPAKAMQDLAGASHANGQLAGARRNNVGSNTRKGAELLPKNVVKEPE